MVVHLLLDNDIREFNMAINEKYAPKEEPVPEEIETKSEEDKNVTPT